jgi:hypothetical protein
MRILPFQGRLATASRVAGQGVARRTMSLEATVSAAVAARARGPAAATRAAMRGSPVRGRRTGRGGLAAAQRRPRAPPTLPDPRIPICIVWLRSAGCNLYDTVSYLK